MPANDQGTISITVGLRPGLGIEKANEILSEVEDYVANDEDVESYMLSYGSSRTQYLGRLFRLADSIPEGRQKTFHKESG